MEEELREEAAEEEGGSLKCEKEGKEKDEEAKEDIEGEKEDEEPSRDDEDTGGNTSEEEGDANVKDEEEEGGSCVILFVVGSRIPFLDFGVTVRA